MENLFGLDFPVPVIDSDSLGQFDIFVAPNCISSDDEKVLWPRMTLHDLQITITFHEVSSCDYLQARN